MRIKKYHLFTENKIDDVSKEEIKDFFIDFIDSGDWKIHVKDLNGAIGIKIVGDVHGSEDRVDDFFKRSESNIILKKCIKSFMSFSGYELDLIEFHKPDLKNGTPSNYNLRFSIPWKVGDRGSLTLESILKEYPDIIHDELYLAALFGISEQSIEIVSNPGIEVTNDMTIICPMEDGPSWDSIYRLQNVYDSVNDIDDVRNIIPGISYSSSSVSMDWRKLFQNRLFARCGGHLLKIVDVQKVGSISNNRLKQCLSGYGLVDGEHILIVEGI